MDESTALVLALQLLALFSIAGALLLYLLCKIRTNGGSDLLDGGVPGAGKPVLITSADTAIGLQIAIHLADRGFRVFAGLKDGAASDSSDDSTSAKVIRAWQKHRESVQGQGILVALPMDVTREDLLHEAVDVIRAHLPAGADGIWAVVNTSGLSYRGRLDQQDIGHWDAMLKTNVVGILRTARKFQSLLRNAGGRIITIGATENLGAGLVAYVASRYAVEGASKALRQELSPLGIKVVTINPQGIMPELLFSAPKLSKLPQAEVLTNSWFPDGSRVKCLRAALKMSPAMVDETSATLAHSVHLTRDPSGNQEKNGQQDNTYVEMSGCMEYLPVVLSSRALRVLDVAVTTRNPKTNYNLEDKLWCKPLEIFKIV